MLTRVGLFYGLFTPDIPSVYRWSAYSLTENHEDEERRLQEKFIKKKVKTRRRKNIMYWELKKRGTVHEL